MMSLDQATAALDAERARTLLRNLKDEEYRVYMKPEGTYLRDSGPFPKHKRSEYAVQDAQELHDLLMHSAEVSALINMADNLGLGLYVTDIDGENRVVFAKRATGEALPEDVLVTARLA